MFGGLRGFEGDDYGVEIAEHGAVHLGQASVAAGFGSGDQLESLLPLRVVLGRNSLVVRNIGQVKHALACGQDRCIGSPQ
jgi:hypothetical protein